MKRNSGIAAQYAVNLKSLDDNTFLKVYNRVIDIAFQLEMKYKKVANKRKFDISEHWTVCFEGSKAVFSILKTMPDLLAMELLKGFETANNY